VGREEILNLKKLFCVAKFPLFLRRKYGGDESFNHTGQPKGGKKKRYWESEGAQGEEIGEGG